MITMADVVPAGIPDPSSGGKARAAKLTAEERQQIARRAAEARWDADIPEAAHTGVLSIAGRDIACAVLEDGRRVLTQESFLLAIGRSRKGKGGQSLTSPDGLPPFLAPDNLKPFITDDLKRATAPILFRSPPTGDGRGQTGKRAYGYDATLLQMVCEVYLRAKEAGKTTRQQDHVVRKCSLLMCGLARVGIIALVDEATGYQQYRARRALEEILEEFISKELLRWTKMFPDEFYGEMFRLKKWSYHHISTKRPIQAANLTNDIVYERLAPGVLEELKRIVPKDDKGRRKHKYHQRLTEDVGHPRLREHLNAVTALMRASDDWQMFHRLLNRSLPKQPQVKTLFDDVPAAGEDPLTNPTA
jgi:P63C domain